MSKSVKIHAAMSKDRQIVNPESPFPRDVSPMLPKGDQPPPSHPEDWFCEVKWNGVRAIVYIEKGKDAVVVRTKPRKRGYIGRNIASQFPELEPGFRKLGQKHSLTLDGEIVSGHGKTMEDMTNVVRRLSSGQMHVAELVQSHPCQFVAFDILYRDGEDLKSAPLERRKNILGGILRNMRTLLISPNPFRKADNDLFFRGVRFGGHEGVVFKRRNSLYRPGVESSDWLKFKFRR